MSEAFKKHVPLWVFMVVGLLVVIGLIYVFGWDNRDSPPTDAEQTSLNTQASFGSVRLDEVASGLEGAVDIASTGITQDERLFVVLQSGQIKIVDGGGVISDEPLIDLSAQIVSGGEQGLLGMVFDPDLADHPYIYVNFTAPSSNGRQSVIARYTLNENQTVADLESQKIILFIEQPYTNHNAGDLAFGPDGYLYIPMGDGGDSGDPQNYAQNRQSLLGKIMRLDVRGEPYSIPSDNPFVGSNSTRPEIWSLGWRNPWRFSFDAQTGDMWVADVGQNRFEEINREPADTGGRNYGWRCYEAREAFNTEGCADASNYTFPVYQYDHEGDRCSGSVTGGFVYRGFDYPQMDGYYFFADYCKGRVYALDSSDPSNTARLVEDTDLGITSFGVDSGGELYLVDAKGGGLYRVVPL